MKISGLVFSLLGLLLCQNSFSQYPGGGQYQGGMATDGKITGVVTDASTGQPIEYAIVAIHKMKDSSLVTGTTCNATGSFAIENLSYGKFYAEITFVGYKKLVVPKILVFPNQKIANIGTVKLEASVTNINEVVVTGNKSIEYKIDKKVVDISSNIVAAGGTVVDALQNTPSVQTDVQGNVTLRGNANFTVLIDGKPSPLAGTEALQQIPANLVQNVEIITNPSAKYDAEGTAGIINVVMKKQMVTGMNGIINVTGGTGNDFSVLDKRGANMNLNYKYSKFNFTFGADYTDMKYAMTSYSLAQNTDSLHRPVLDRTVNGTGAFHRQGKGLKFGVDYDINKNSTISFMGSIGSRNMYRPNIINNNDIHYDTLKNIISKANYISNSTNEAIRSYYNLNLSYQIKLDDKGQQLSVSSYFNAGPDNVPSTVLIDTTNSNWTSLQKNQPRLQVAQNSFETEFRENLDYALPIGEKGKLEAGYQGRIYQNKGSASVWVDTLSTETNKYLPGKDFLSPNQQLLAKDQIHAGYVSFSNSSFIDYQFGIRAEYEMRDIKFGKDTTMHKLFWSPSMHLSKELPWDLQLQASYTRRIDRPREWNLNPVPRYQSLTSVMKGDPGLQPEIANSFELNLQKKLNETSFISIESFFKQTDQKMYPKPGFENNLNTITFENLGHDRSIGAEFTLNLAPARFINFNASSSIYNYRIFGMPNIPNVTQHDNINTWNIKVNPTIRMPWGMGIQINYTYNAKTLTATGGNQLGYYSSGFGIRQELMKHKANLTLQAQNPIGFSRVVTTSFGDNTTSYGWNQRESKVYMLTFSYRFNNYKVQTNKRSQDDTNGGEQDMNGGGF